MFPEFRILLDLITAYYSWKRVVDDAHTDMYLYMYALCMLCSTPTSVGMKRHLCCGSAPVALFGRNRGAGGGGSPYHSTASPMLLR